jgi:hypothetical protein
MDASASKRTNLTWKFRGKLPAFARTPMPMQIVSRPKSKNPGQKEERTSTLSSSAKIQRVEGDSRNLSRHSTKRDSGVRDNFWTGLIRLETKGAHTLQLLRLKSTRDRLTCFAKTTIIISIRLLICCLAVAVSRAWAGSSSADVLG